MNNPVFLKELVGKLGGQLKKLLEERVCEDVK